MIIRRQEGNKLDLPAAQLSAEMNANIQHVIGRGLYFWAWMAACGLRNRSVIRSLSPIAWYLARS